MEKIWNIATDSAMRGFGRNLQNLLQPGDCVFCHGDLGMGKTTLVRGYLQAKAPDLKVKSPSYSILEEYDGVVHADLYRIGTEEELLHTGLMEYLASPDITCFIEWPTMVPLPLSVPDFHVYISLDGKGGRDVRIKTTRREAELTTWAAWLRENDS